MLRIYFINFSSVCPETRAIKSVTFLSEQKWLNHALALITKDTKLPDICYEYWNLIWLIREAFNARVTIYFSLSRSFHLGPSIYLNVTTKIIRNTLDWFCNFSTKIHLSSRNSIGNIFNLNTCLLIVKEKNIKKQNSWASWELKLTFKIPWPSAWKVKFSIKWNRKSHHAIWTNACYSGHTSMASK